jgi:hypothetical protein
MTYSSSLGSAEDAKGDKVDVTFAVVYPYQVFYISGEVMRLHIEIIE